MSSYEQIATKILKYLNDCYETGKDPSNWQITRLGIEYFKENSLITKTYKQLKEIKDWLPLT